jgi:hypothetical protein
LSWEQFWHRFKSVLHFCTTTAYTLRLEDEIAELKAEKAYLINLQMRAAGQPPIPVMSVHPETAATPTAPPAPATPGQPLRRPRAAVEAKMAELERQAHEKAEQIAKRQAKEEEEFERSVKQAIETRKAQEAQK